MSKNKKPQSFRRIYDFNLTKDKGLSTYLTTQGFVGVDYFPKGMYLGSLHNAYFFEEKGQKLLPQKGTSVYVKYLSTTKEISCLYVVFTMMKEKTYLFDLYNKGQRQPEWLKYPLTWDEGFSLFETLTKGKYEYFDTMSFGNQERLRKKEAMDRLESMLKVMFPKLYCCFKRTYGRSHYTFKSKGISGLTLCRSLDGSVMLASKRMTAYIVDIFTLNDELHDTPQRMTVFEAKRFVDDVLRGFKS